MKAICNSEMRTAEIEIQAWMAPGTSLDAMTEGLLDSYLQRSEADRLDFVAALIGRIMISEARKRQSIKTAAFAKPRSV